MYYHIPVTRIWLAEYVFKVSGPTQVFQEWWSGVPPPPHPENETFDRSWHFEFKLVLSTPSPTQMKIWPDLGTSGLSWSNRCIPKDTVSLKLFVTEAYCAASGNKMYLPQLKLCDG